MDINRIAVKISKKAEYFVLKGHPWIYADSIEKLSDTANNGDMAVIYSKKSNKLFAIGLIDMDSNIRIRVFSVKKSILDFENHIYSKIVHAEQLRRISMPPNTDAYRLVYGENDKLPGLIIDNYNNRFVIKFYSSLWLPYIDVLKNTLRTLYDPKEIVTRFNRKLKEKYPTLVENSTLRDDQIQSETTIIHENGIQYEVNLLKGHKTGYFLDHRFNRKEIRGFSKNKNVLDVFSYAGGFALNALYGGAHSITCIDINPKAIQQIKRNIDLNGFDLSSANLVTGDAIQSMKELIAKKNTYDLIIIDPPSYSKDSKNKELALKSYRNLFHLGVQALSRDGTLVMASCSSKINSDDLKKTLLPLAQQHKLRIIKETSHDFDHPQGIAELNYLKTLYYQK